MSMIRSAKLALIALSVLAFPSVSHAETPAVNEAGHSELAGVNTITNNARSNVPTVSNQEIDCLARNIYHEARGEPRNGKIAVGIVTINRRNDSRFPNTICGVINQRTRAVCQFSWRCHTVRAPVRSDQNWLESQQIARSLLTDRGFFQQFRQRMGNILFFHAQYVRPAWSRSKVRLYAIGAHFFYGER